MSVNRLGLSGDLLAALAELAARDGSSAEQLAGRILAEEIPDVLAEAARIAFAPLLAPDAATALELPPTPSTVSSILTTLSPGVASSIPRGVPTSGAPGRAAD